jgi:hypothetical protein
MTNVKFFRISNLSDILCPLSLNEQRLQYQKTKGKEKKSEEREPRIKLLIY